MGLPHLELTAVSECRMEDEWVIGPGGIPVFIDPHMSTFLRSMVLDASTSEGNLPKFVVRRHEEPIDELW